MTRSWLHPFPPQCCLPDFLPNAACPIYRPRPRRRSCSGIRFLNFPSRARYANSASRQQDAALSRERTPNILRACRIARRRLPDLEIGGGAARLGVATRIPWLAGTVLVVLGIAAIATVIARARMTGNLFLSRPWGLIFPAIGLLAMYGVFTAARRRRDAWPFALTAVFFVAALLSLAVMFWPYMIPYTITVGNRRGDRLCYCRRDRA